MKRAFLVTLVALALLLASSGAALAAPGGTTWLVPGDFATIQQAIDSPAVASGDTIVVGPGEWAGATVNKQLTIEGEDGAIIVGGGPLHPAGFYMGFNLEANSGGTIISHFTFAGADLAIRNAAAVDGVTVTHCVFLHTLQGVSNWGGSDWTITHNVFKDLWARNGGGIAILIGDRSFTPGGVNGNVVSYNKISGLLDLVSGEGGGYNGAGVSIYADFRNPAWGALLITGNVISHNRVNMVSENPDLVDFDAVELSYATGQLPPPDDKTAQGVIYGNLILFNDLRGSANTIALNPTALEASNTISRNLGHVPNRGHGLTPAVF